MQRHLDWRGCSGTVSNQLLDHYYGSVCVSIEVLYIQYHRRNFNVHSLFVKIVTESIIVFVFMLRRWWRVAVPTSKLKCIIMHLASCSADVNIIVTFVQEVHLVT